jgi:hypothetical protein
MRSGLLWDIMQYYDDIHIPCNNPEEHRANKAVHTMKTHRRSTSLAPLIHNLGTGQMSVQLHALTTTLSNAKDPPPPSQHPVNEN